MTKFFEQIHEYFARNRDFISTEIRIFGHEVHVWFLSSLVDLQKTQELLNQLQVEHNERGDMIESIAATLGANSYSSSSELMPALLEGKFIVFMEDDSSFLVIEPVSASITRDITTSQHENVLLSSYDAFTENLQTNIGLLRTN
ncbi:spore germination protein [Paenibacillus sp. N3.4]|nr:spore germination protein [Paenibacillus sp. N3.4]TXK83736.1 spore germination protein [Paenibacillus sp. N3.4]